MNAKWDHGALYGRGGLDWASWLPDAEVWVWWTMGIAKHVARNRDEGVVGTRCVRCRFVVAMC